MEAATPNVFALDYVSKPFELMDMLDNTARSPDRIHSQREAFTARFTFTDFRLALSPHGCIFNLM